MSELAAGFVDAAHDAQRLFRVLLDAFSRPGRIVNLSGAPSGPGKISPAMVAYLLTLADRDTPLWLAPELDTDALRDFIRFHLGSPLVADRAQATLAVLTQDVASLEGFAVGTDSYPDRSATLLIEVPALGQGTPRTWRGPGIDGAVRVAVGGLGETFWQSWAENHALFPCGVDIVFATGSRLLALPRSIAVED
jgi:alpha-D-ribose 1-methylphosphonate 5-triphosphate synthase subunit PhnH